MKKKILPVLIAIVLIVIVVGVAFGKQILDKYSYSNEHYDMLTYFENSSDEDIAIVLGDKFKEERATLLNGTYYVDLDFVHTYFNSRFFYDENESLLIYTEPDKMIIAPIDSTEITVGGSAESLSYIPATVHNGTLLVALDYVKRYTNFEYEAFTDPGRLQIYTEFTERQVATVKKDTAVRYRGGVKSPILEEMKAGDKLYVLEVMEDWAKVKTEDAVLGYVETKRLSDTMSETPIPPDDYEEPVYTDVCRDHKINMGWHAIAGPGGNDTLEEYVSNTKALNVVAPTWFGLTDNEGNYYSYASESYVTRAHNMGLEVWAVIDNITYNTELDMTTILSTTSIRQRLISNLISDALSLGIDGINVDLETLPTSAGEGFSEFIRELSIPCRANGLVLSVDNYVPIGGTGYYDRQTQGEVADYVVIMGYDEHYAGSEEAGSVASIDYVEQGITMTLEEVPSYKVINGIPFYTRIWTTNGLNLTSQAVDMETANEWLSNHGLSKTFDDTTCQNYAEYTGADGSLNQCWFEDADSIQVKLNVMENYDLGGVAEWRLGYETSDVWDVIADYVNN